MELIDKPSPTPTIGYLGAVDDDRQGRLSGWAITRQGDPCVVTATVNGRSFTAASDLPRPDLAAKGQSRGAGGWRIELADALEPGENRIDITLPDGTPLSGSPRMVAWTPAPAAAPAPRHLGAIDSANARLLSGWALTATGDACEVTITVGDGDPVTILSEGTRADLAAKGMSRGAGGWHLFLEDRLMPGANRVTIALPDGSAMPGSPLTIEGQAITPVANPAPAPVTAPPTPSASAVVTELPPRQRPAMPSLAELDELSLDEIALAVASGRVRVDAPSPPEPVAPPVVAQPAPEAAPSPRRSWVARLLGR
ncbi:hypothetical protein ASE73_15665 [Sphingomonas sp. Leaf24]|uniref:hypothetical protein n=1 Tax=unclassified Sphingomonas TaxID=196159 RepID=UPI0006FD7ED5|nr:MULTISPECIES: hypothetical protein [unclassified Sphingomonas]KQM21485.1 hypothetical protein ASE50_13895 [Sphingomonas sp. Leaf5]KQM93601.1 hypothetical protein ASE73_15665 [Sphingomonas sp. Leaf24]